eukprot:scaffold8081_cov239-Pinguiococcus_pyrenoidosus.AAC.5
MAAELTSQTAVRGPPEPLVPAARRGPRPPRGTSCFARVGKGPPRPAEAAGPWQAAPLPMRRPLAPEMLQYCDGHRKRGGVPLDFIP